MKNLNGYQVNAKEIFQIHGIMRTKKCCKIWIGCVFKSSVSLLECHFDDDLWRAMWKKICLFYDCNNPQMPSKISDIQITFKDMIDQYNADNVFVLGEVPRVRCKQSILEKSKKFSAYFVPSCPPRIDANLCLDDDFQDISIRIGDVIEEGFNFLRVEASEIIAFVGTDSDRIVRPGLPPHIPIAYGLRGSSMPMTVMRNMVDDIRNELHRRKTSVLCEVYDGQFHPIIVKTSTGKPLTRIQLAQEHFRDTLKNQTKQQLLDILLPYSEICASDLEQLSNMPFRNHHSVCMECITVDMRRVIRKINNTSVFIFQTHITSNKVGNFSMKDIVTKHREDIWNKYADKYKNMYNATSACPTELTENDLCKIIKGTKLHRRLTHRQTVVHYESENSDSESDADFRPSEVEAEFSDSAEEPSSSDDDESIHNTSIVSVTSTGTSCIKDILNQLKEITNKHKWRDETIDSLLQKYMSSRRALSKLFMYEMDIMNNLIHSQFGVNLFKKKDNKETRIRKIYAQLKNMPQLLSFKSSSDEQEALHNPLKLVDIYRHFILSNKYPKEYLAAIVCKINHMENVTKWESLSPIPICLDLPFDGEQHIIFNYPEKSAEQNQTEMRTFDYTHVLNNLRYYVSTDRINGISSNGFLAVSSVDHDLLPRTIVEDKLDRQNCAISQRFFSAAVQKILSDLGYDAEAEFSEHTMNWFRACDERGMDVRQRLFNLHKMYEYLLSTVNLADYPPPMRHIAGLPIKTFEALLHTISTRFSLFVLAKKNCYNTRAVSTLAVESFFSDLSRYEFSGLGAPKAVDIPN